jgi:hypothetical protein
MISPSGLSLKSSLKVTPWKASHYRYPVSLQSCVTLVFNGKESAPHTGSWVELTSIMTVWQAEQGVDLHGIMAAHLLCLANGAWNVTKRPLGSDSLAILEVTQGRTSNFAMTLNNTLSCKFALVKDVAPVLSWHEMPILAPHVHTLHDKFQQYSFTIATACGPPSCHSLLLTRLGRSWHVHLLADKILLLNGGWQAPAG